MSWVALTFTEAEWTHRWEKSRTTSDVARARGRRRRRFQMGVLLRDICPVHGQNHLHLGEDMLYFPNVANVYLEIKCIRVKIRTRNKIIWSLFSLIQTKSLQTNLWCYTLGHTPLKQIVVYPRTRGSKTSFTGSTRHRGGGSVGSARESQGTMKQWKKVKQEASARDSWRIVSTVVMNSVHTRSTTGIVQLICFSLEY